VTASRLSFIYVLHKIVHVAYFDDHFVLSWATYADWKQWNSETRVPRIQCFSAARIVVLRIVRLMYACCLVSVCTVLQTYCVFVFLRFNLGQFCIDFVLPVT